MNHETLGLILAGGSSSRFRDTAPEGAPSNKLLMPIIEDQTGIDVEVQRLASVGVTEANLILVINSALSKTVTTKYPEAVVLEQPEAERKGNGFAAQLSLETLSHYPDDAHIILMQADDGFSASVLDLKHLIGSLKTSQLSLVGVQLNSQSEQLINMSGFWHALTDDQGKVLKVFKGRDQVETQLEVMAAAQAAVLMNLWVTTVKILKEYLPQLQPNAQEKNEVVLPDLINLLIEAQVPVSLHLISNYLGFNTWQEYQQAQRLLSEVVS